MAIKCNAQIIKIVQETPRVKVFRLKPEEPLAYIPGQFMMISIDGLTNLNGTLLKRSYSIASKASDDYLEFCIARMENGTMSQKMHAMKEGDFVHVEGPYGNFKMKDNDAPIILIAGGSGISPIMSMLRTLFERKATQQIQLFFGVRNPEEIIYIDELSDYAKNHANFELIIGFSDPGLDIEERLSGYIHEVVRKHDPSPKDCYICGPPQMIKAVKEVLEELHFEKERIQIDQW